MKPEQKIIAAWMLRIMEQNNWSAKDWADRAQISPTTVSRAVKEDYQSVTSVSNLVRLAEAAGKPSILDFLHNS